MNNRNSFLDRLDDLLRHQSVLGRHVWLRDLLRKPYHRVLQMKPGGYALRLGGCVEVRLPPEFKSKLMEAYEVEEFREIKRWCDEVEGGWFIDVGSSVGYMSCAALFANRAIQALAIDTDLNSLQSVGRVCRYAGSERLHRVRAMITEQAPAPVGLSESLQQTAALLDNPAISGDPGTHAYVNLDSPLAGTINRISLDQLLQPIAAEGMPLLIKCDIEGAEYGALLGMKSLMAEVEPRLLLSVHPEKLQAFGYNVQMVSDLLTERKYTYTEIAVDHERHWLAVPSRQA